GSGRSRRPAVSTQTTSPPRSRPTRLPRSRCPSGRRPREHAGEEGARAALPCRREHPPRNRPARGARRRRCRPRDRPRSWPPDRLPRRAGFGGARDRARPLSRAGARRSACRARERRPAIRRRPGLRSGRARGGADYPRLKAVVGAAFAHRRKQMPNSIELVGLASREQAAEALARIGRDPSTRAEALAPEEFLALTNALE